jgi:hypothetical protein
MVVDCEKKKSLLYTTTKDPWFVLKFVAEPARILALAFSYSRISALAFSHSRIRIIVWIRTIEISRVYIQNESK